MSNKLARPTDLQRLLRANEDYYSTMHNKMRFAHRLYKREWLLDVDLPDGISTHRSSTATLIVDQLRDQIDSGKPNVTAQRSGGSKRAGRVATKQELWGRHVLDTIAEEGLVAPVDQAKTDLFLRGAAAWKFWPKKETLHLLEDEADLADLFPFHVESRDPLLLFPSPGKGQLKYMIEAQDRRVMDIWEGYPGWSDPKAKKLSRKQRENPLRPVRWVEFWSWVADPDTGQYEGWYIVEVDGENIIEIPNMLMRVPYVYRYSGMGRANDDGDPSELAINILGLMDGELIEEIKVKTAMSAQWQFHVFPVLEVQGITASDAHKMLRTGPGAILEVPPGIGSVKWLEREAPNPQMLEFLSEIKSNMSQKVSPALAGGGTAEFGIHEALNIGQALKVTQGPRNSLNYMGGQLLDGLAGLMDLFDIEMNVHGALDNVEEDRMVSGKDFKHRKFQVEFEATDPSENDRRMLALLAVERVPGALSHETFAKVALKDIVEDWDDEAEKILAEGVIERLTAAGIFDQAVVQELGLLQQQAAVEIAEGEAQNRAQGAVAGAAAEVAGRERNVEGLAGVAPLVDSRAAQGQGLTNAE